MRRHSEEGASLLLAVVFVTVVGLVMGALLPYARSGIGEAGTARDVRSVQHAADGAVDGAISSIRGSLVSGSRRIAAMRGSWWSWGARGC